MFWIVESCCFFLEAYFKINYTCPMPLQSCMAKTTFENSLYNSGKRAEFFFTVVSDIHLDHRKINECLLKRGNMSSSYTDAKENRLRIEPDQ